MTTSIYADVVAGIAFGNEGAKRWVKVGVLLKHSDNDALKGPGFTVLLDKYFNPAGVPGKPGDSSIGLSCYWPKEKEERKSAGAYKLLAPEPMMDLPDDDIPF